MLNYGVQYDIANGIFLTFKNNLAKRSYSVSHGQNTRDKAKAIFPYYKYESFTKENFISVCLYLMLTKSPSSVNGLYEMLKDIDPEDAFKFKDSIINYKLYVPKDIMYLREQYGDPSVEQMFKEYKRNKIKFYTIWFFLKYKDIDVDDYIIKHKINGQFLQKIKQLMLFITFSDKAMSNVKLLFEETDLLKGCE